MAAAAKGEVWVTVDDDGIPVGCGLEEAEERETASGVPGARVFRYVPESLAPPKRRTPSRKERLATTLCGPVNQAPPKKRAKVHQRKPKQKAKA